MADGKEYISCPDELGTIHISEDVLAVTAAAAALEVENVGSLAGNLGGDIVELLAGKKNLSRGVRVGVTEGSVSVDISLLVKYGFSVQESASCRISRATMEKPAPAAPARAASMEAFTAIRLVEADISRIARVKTLIWSTFRLFSMA